MHSDKPAPAARHTFSGLIGLSLLATWVIWGSTYMAIKITLHSIAPLWGMGLRFVAAGGLLLAWARWRGAAWPTLVQWRNAAIIGALMLGGGTGFTAVAEVSVGSGLVVSFIAVIPLLMVVLNRFWGVRSTGMEWLSIVVGLAGVVLLTQGAGFQAAPQGLLAVSVACLTWTLGSVLSQRTLLLADGAMGYASEMLAGGLVLCIMSTLAGEAHNWVWPLDVLLAWLYLLVFGSIIAFSAYMVLLRHVSPALASSYSFVNPVIAMLLGVGILGETVTTTEWMAVAVILSGVLLMLWARMRSSPG